MPGQGAAGARVARPHRSAGLAGFLIGALVAGGLALGAGAAWAQVPADPGGTRPPTLAAPQTESARPHVTPAPPAAGEIKEPVKAPTAADRPPQYTGFPELIHGEGDSRSLLKD